MRLVRAEYTAGWCQCCGWTASASASTYPLHRGMGTVPPSLDNEQTKAVRLKQYIWIYGSACCASRESPESAGAADAVAPAAGRHHCPPSPRPQSPAAPGMRVLFNVHARGDWWKLRNVKRNAKWGRRNDNSSRILKQGDCKNRVGLMDVVYISIITSNLYW